MTLQEKLTRLKEIVGRATLGPWRYVNEIDPNPIFLQTWGPNYKTMHFVQAGGENDTPTSSSLRNITPKITFLPKSDAEFIAQSRTIIPQLITALEIAIKALKLCDSSLKCAKPCVNGGEEMDELLAEKALSQIRKCLGAE